MPSSILYFSYSKFINKMAAKISENVTTLHDGLANNEHKKHNFGPGVYNNIFGVREFSYDVSEGQIATIIKQWHINIITTIIVKHEIFAPKFSSANNPVKFLF